METEEENCIRLFLLVNSLALNAVKTLFDQKIPPQDLQWTLQQNRQNIESLVSKRVINQAQLGLMFPTAATQVSDSRQFDITLMICLLRNLRLVNEPAGGFDKLPGKSDESEGADIARIKYYRNSVGHNQSITIKEMEFEIAWLELSKAVSRLTAGAMDEQCDQLKVKSLDNKTEEYKKEIKEMQREIDDLNKYKEQTDTLVQTKIDQMSTLFASDIDLKLQGFVQRRTKELDPETYAKWDNENKKMVTTFAVNHILKTLKTKNILTVTGISGSGKTASLRHVAIYYKKKGYIIVPSNSPVEILEHFGTKTKTLFVMDDVCGEHIMNAKIDMWHQYESQMESMLKNENIKVITSAILHNFNDKQFKEISILRRNTCNLSNEKFARSFRDNALILANHFPKGQIHLVLKLIFRIEINEILPYISLIENLSEVLDPTFNLVELMSKKIGELKGDKEKYCALFIFLVNKGCLNEYFFKSNFNQEFREQMQNILFEFDLGRGTTKRKILDKLDALTGTYLTKVGSNYLPISDNIFGALSEHFCKEMMETVLRYADGKLICQRFYLQTSPYDTGTVVVPKSLETQYFEKIVSELLKGKLCDIFKSHQMTYPFYRLSLKKVIMDLDFKVRKKLLNMEDKDEQHVSFLYLVCKLGFIDFVLVILDNVDDINSFSHFLPLNVACRKGHLNIVKLLLKRGSDLTKYDSKDLNSLLEACKGGHLEVVKLLIRHNANINAKSSEGLTPLYTACVFGHKEIVEFLLSQGGHVNECRNSETTPLMSSCYFSHKEIFDILLSYNANVNLSNFEGATALGFACQSNNLYMVCSLLQNGADVNYSRVKGVTELMKACSQDNIDIAGILIENGADPNKSTVFECTALHVACAEGHVSIVELLLKKGVDINKKDVNGISPLGCAARNSKERVVEILLKCKAKVHNREKDSRSALSEACLGGSMSIVKLLIEKGSEVNHQCFREFTPLMAACHSGNKPIVLYLIQIGADVNIISSKGWTALFSACTGNKSMIVEKLIESHANINVTNNLGISPLMCASFYENLAVVGLLIKHGGDLTKTNRYGHSILSVISRTGSERFVAWMIKKLSNTNIINQKDKNGWTPLMHACSVGHLEKSKLLIDEGAEIKLKEINGWNCLMFASENGNDLLVNLLISKGQLVNHVDVNGCSALSIASYNGHLRTIELLLLNGANVDHCDRHMWTPLMWACIGKQVDAIKLLLGYGANINTHSDEGKSPLLWACEAGEDDIVDLCMEEYHQCSIENGTHRWVFLMWSVKHGNIETLNECLTRGVDVNKADNDGITPLIAATYNKHFEFVKLLVHNNATVNAVDNQGWSALKWAAQLSYTDIFIFLLFNGACITGADWLRMLLWCSKKRLSFTTLLNSFIEQDVDLNSVDSQGRTPLLLSCLVQNYDHILTLCKHKANLYKADRRKRFPIMEICRKGNYEIYSLLMKNRSYYCNVDINGNTCLIEAVKGGNEMIIRNLLKVGADVQGQNKRMWSAKEEARWRGFTEIVKILESKQSFQ